MMFKARPDCMRELGHKIMCPDLLPLNLIYEPLV